MSRRASRSIKFRVLRPVAALLVVASVAFASESARAQGKGKKVEEPPTKNWSIPWFLTLVCFAGLIAPVCVAARRQWDLPFHLDQMEEEKQREREKAKKK